jgi:hypothetical protein
MDPSIMRADDHSPVGPSRAAGRRPARTLRQRLIRAAIVLVAVYFLLLVVMMLLEEKLIYFPTKYPDGDWTGWGMAPEEAHFQSADGTQIVGWFIPHDQPRAVVLYAEGNAGNMTYRGDVLQRLHRLDVAVMIFDYRGYGKSEGSPSEAGILADARAARAWLARRTGTPENKIVLMGESLGGGVMVDLAANDGAGGLILQNTFTSLPDVAQTAYPWLPVRQLMRSRLDSLSKIGSYRGPLLQCHGDADEIIPYELGRRLFDAAPDPRKVFITIPGGRHNDPIAHVFSQALGTFFGRVAGSR